MPAPNGHTMTIYDLMEHLSSNESLRVTLRSELRSRLRRFCEVCRKSPTEIIAEPASIRAESHRANWHQAGLSAGAWANIKSSVTRAMTLTGIAVHRRRRNFALSDDWEGLLAPLSRRDSDELHRFAGWCTTLKVKPDQVDQTVFEQFLAYLQDQSILTNPKERWHVARRAWNRAISPSFAWPIIADVVPAGWKGLSWEDFPASLRDEIALYRQAMVAPDHFSDDQRRAIKTISVDGYLACLKRHLSRIVETGVPAAHFSRLAACVDVALTKRGMMRFLDGRDLDERTRPTLHATMVAILSIARHAEVPEDKLQALNALFEKVRHRPSGMTQKNKQRLSQFETDQAKTAIIGLPFKVAAQLKTVQNPTVRQAQRMQLAALLGVLLRVPLRIKNAAALDLAIHIQRPANGAEGRWLVHIPASEVKNGKAIDACLDVRTSALLARYVDVFRPKLMDEFSTSLFIGQSGLTKDPHALSRQFSRFVKREIGFIVNAHLMRHMAGFFFLESNPGCYETVRQLLGHKNIATTINFYAGAEAKSAFSQYDCMLEKLLGDEL